MERHLFLFKIAAESVLINKLRGMLTALGVVFGVAAVIAMLAIGSGAKKFLLDQMRLIGTNNIVFEHKPPGDDVGTENEEETTATTAGNESKLETWAPGMSVSDLDVIHSIPSVELLSPEIIRETKAMYFGKILDVRCVGVTNAFFTLNQLTTSKGSFFTEEHIATRKPVCVIGKHVETKLFSGKDPLGQSIKCGNNYFVIIGVLDRRIATRETLTSLGLRDLNSDIFIPLEVSLIRFGDRSRILKEHLGRQGRSTSNEDVQVHQIDRLVVRVDDTKYLQSTADVIARMLKRRHLGQVDFSMEIPELLLQQEQKTQDIFNLVLAVIAGISLLVGGIGIMNIMLASVYERIKEIGLRRAIGATSRDIVFQFLFEAIIVSIIGGILGVLLGVVAAKAISTAAEIPTMISWWSIVLSFGVAASIGLIFGIFPAQKAAKLDPIEALRTE
ncbi:MAG TPA: ABC transporter permease [Saprospiraceae bacterium]|nr:ABC transporter permease [Saprospiraceae bacterium]